MGSFVVSARPLLNDVVSEAEFGAEGSKIREIQEKRHGYSKEMA